jgi:hypothetical protein
MMSVNPELMENSASGPDGRHWRRPAWMLHFMVEASNNGV